MAELGGIARLIILIGAVMMMMGIVFLFIDKIPWLGKLPGDIYIQKKDFSLYLPLTTCTILSILVSAILYFIFGR